MESHLISTQFLEPLYRIILTICFVYWVNLFRYFAFWNILKENLIRSLVSSWKQVENWIYIFLHCGWHIYQYKIVYSNGNIYITQSDIYFHTVVTEMLHNKEWSMYFIILVYTLTTVSCWFFFKSWQSVNCEPLSFRYQALFLNLD